MIEVNGVTRKWGRSSLALVIPKRTAEEEHLKPNQRLKVLILSHDDTVAKTFGILKQWRKPTERIMREIDRELWPKE
jgi:hypothetical protein